MAKTYYATPAKVPSLKPGDTLYLRSGTYTEPFPTIPSGVSWDEPVTISAYPGESVVLRPAGERVISFVGASYISIENLLLDASECTADCVLMRPVVFDSVKKITSGPSHHIRLENLGICGSKGQGVMVNLECNDNEIKRCRIHHNGSGNHYHGIYCESWRNLIENCDVFENTGYGIHVYNGYGWSHTQGNVVRGNRCHDNGNGPDCNGAGIGIYSGPDNQVLTNQCWNNCVGIKLDYGAVRTILKNNLSWGSTAGISYNLFIGTGATGTIRSGNLIGVD